MIGKGVRFVSRPPLLLFPAAVQCSLFRPQEKVAASGNASAAALITTAAKSRPIRNTGRCAWTPQTNTDETVEQRGETFSGGRGGKAAAQGERRAIQHSPTQRGGRVSLTLPPNPPVRRLVTMDAHHARDPKETRLEMPLAVPAAP